MADIDPAKLVAALRKAMTTVEALSRKVEFLEEQNAKHARTADELAQHQTRLRTEMARIDVEIVSALNALLQGHMVENERLHARLGEQEKDLCYLQSYVAGHETELIRLTGRRPELVWSENDPETEIRAADVAGVEGPTSCPGVVISSSVAASPT